MASSGSKLDCDRYGVPQYAGETELFEEYVERAWDLYYGREGQDSLQVSTPLHLRAQLSSTAYESVRKLDHSKLRTTTSEGRPTLDGMKLLLKTLKEAIAQEAPVRVNELFLQYFYSPSVWRKPQESMGQYIIRREADFTRLKEASSETELSDNLKCMLLLIFSGIDNKEQQNILSSVNNEYNYRKVSHALRIQFPTTMNRPVMRKDYLGAGRSSMASTGRHARWKGSSKGRQVFAATDETEEIYDLDDEDQAYYEEEDTGDYEALAADEDGSEDETLDALISEMPESLEDADVAEAFATIAQHRFSKGKGKGKKGSGRGTSSAGSTTSFPFRATGDLSFDQKARENRKAATAFLKSVTVCTACNQKGHWVGDAECPRSSKKGKGKSFGSSNNVAKKKSTSPKKKTSTTYFVLHDWDGGQDGNSVNYVIDDPFVPAGDDTLENTQVPVDVEIPESFGAQSNDKALEYDFDLKPKNVADESYYKVMKGQSGRPIRFTNSFEYEEPCKSTEETFMVLHERTDLCEHAACNGGDERHFHRGANGHTRHVTCKDCSKTVLKAYRKNGTQLWSYLFQIAMYTFWGRAARSRSIAQTAANYADEKAEEMYPTAVRTTRKWGGTSPPSPSRSPSSPDAWSMVSDSEASGYNKKDVKPSKKGPGKATIIYEEEQCWLYGVHLTPAKELPSFPELGEADMKVLQPLPEDTTTFTKGPMTGFSFGQVASLVETEWYCRCTMDHFYRNRPMIPETYRFAFYLHGRKLTLVRSAGMRLLKSSDAGHHEALKRTMNPDSMQSSRTIQVPVQTDIHEPNSIRPHFCDVMMVDEEEAEAPDLNDESLMLTEDDPPGLAILDSGCTKTMHGSQWAQRFEEALAEYNKRPIILEKTQKFHGVGGETISTMVKIFPIGIGGNDGEIHSAETEGSTPLLISRPFMQDLGTVIDFAANTVTFDEIGVYALPLVRTARGHLAVNLLDFEVETHEEEEEEGTPMTRETGTAETLGATTYDSPQPSSSPQPSLSQRQLPEPPQLQQSQPDSPSHSDDYRRYAPSEAYYDSDMDPYDPEVHHLRQVERDHLDDLRRDVEGYEEFQRELRRSGDDQQHLHEGFHCEDVEVFESMVTSGHFVRRKTTNKKSKRLQSMVMTVESEDFTKNRKLRGLTPKVVTNKPPIGRTWLKQIFAGQMGVSLLAVFYGMMVASPLDYNIVDWDATTRQAIKWIHQDMQVEDPYVTIITHPCGPWGAWSRFNLAKGGKAAVTVLHLREEQRPLLRLVAKVIKDRVKAKRHVFVEQPFGSQSLYEEEMKDVLELIEAGTLIFIKVDGCTLGYKDAESLLPHKKPSYYLTTMLSAESVFQDCVCPGDHQHQPLEGRNKFGPRTPQAAEWPHELNQKVIDCIIQQSVIEQTVLENTADAYPSERRPPPQQQQPSRQRNRRKKGRTAILTGDFQTPPVYIRPDVAESEVQPLPAEADPDSLPQLDDDASYRSRQAMDLDPILSGTEAQRRQDWLQIDPEIRKIVRDLHVNFGHPTSATLQRILRRQHAKPEAIRAAGLLWCDACGESIRRKRPKPVRLPNRYEFNRHLMLDTFYAKDVNGDTYGFLNIVDDATNFQVVACFGTVTGPPASRAVLRHFTTSWTSWAGLPHSIQVDRGKEFMALFANHLKQFGVEQEVMPLEAPWKGGRCEKAGDLWKQLWNKVVLESEIAGIGGCATGCFHRHPNKKLLSENKRLQPGPMGTWHTWASTPWFPTGRWWGQTAWGHGACRRPLITDGQNFDYQGECQGSPDQNGYGQSSPKSFTEEVDTYERTISCWILCLFLQGLTTTARRRKTL